MRSSTSFFTLAPISVQSTSSVLAQELSPDVGAYLRETRQPLHVGQGARVGQEAVHQEREPAVVCVEPLEQSRP